MITKYEMIEKIDKLTYEDFSIERLDHIKEIIELGGITKDDFEIFRFKDQVSLRSKEFHPKHRYWLFWRQIKPEEIVKELDGTEASLCNKLAMGMATYLGFEGELE